MTAKDFLIDVYAQQYYYSDPSTCMKVLPGSKIVSPAKVGAWRNLDAVEKRPYLDAARAELRRLGVEDV